MQTTILSEKFIAEIINKHADLINANGDILIEVISWIEDNLRPDEVFNLSTLQDWAENNGYVEE